MESLRDSLESLVEDCLREREFEEELWSVCGLFLRSLLKILR